MFPNEGTIIILSSGWSVAAQKVDVDNLRRFGFVIGVNDSGIAADVECIISMDRLWMECRWEEMKRKNILTLLRKSAWRKNLKDKERWEDLHLFDNDEKSSDLSPMPMQLNGFNSGFCALNLAYLLVPKRLFLFGFDHKKGDQPYWHPVPPYPDANLRASKTGKYVDWSQKYKSAAKSFLSREIKVFNVNPDSAIDDFPKITYQEFLQKCAN